LPKGEELSPELARSLGDDEVADQLDTKEPSSFLIGKRMCG
jgi:hypothetical protein